MLDYYQNAFSWAEQKIRFLDVHLQTRPAIDAFNETILLFFWP